MALLEVKDLWVTRKPGGSSSTFDSPEQVTAVQNVSLEIPDHDVIGVAGETGCGKTSLALAILKVIRPHSGTITFMDSPIHKLREWRFRRFRQEMQMLYSDPADAFHPKWTIARLFQEVFALHNPRLKPRDQYRQMQEYLRMVGLSGKLLQRYPRELSLFDQQRLSIARVLAIRPRLLVCDDPTRYLDTVSQARLLDLLKDLHEHWRTSMLFLARDYSVVDHMSSYIYVMNLGRILEEGTRHDLYHAPQHEYTRQLLALSGAL